MTNNFENVEFTVSMVTEAAQAQEIELSQNEIMYIQELASLKCEWLGTNNVSERSEAELEYIGFRDAALFLLGKERYQQLIKVFSAMWAEMLYREFDK